MDKKKNTGKDFEKLVESIFYKLIKDPKFEKVEHNVFIDGVDGKRQIDILVTAEVVGVRILTIIECKDYKSKVSITTVDEFHSKLIDINANKGIIISAKGFSSKAIAKAKRLGISLYTVQEALNTKWSIDLNIPIIIKELRPIHFNNNARVVLKKEIFYDKSKYPEVNGFKIHELIKKKWEDGTLSFKERNGRQTIVLPEITPPYLANLNLVDKSLIEITDLKIEFDMQIKYFQTSLNNLKGTQILNNIIDQKTEIFIKLNSITEAIRVLEEMRRKPQKNSIALIIDVRVIPEFNLNPSQPAEFLKLTRIYPK